MKRFPLLIFLPVLLTLIHCTGKNQDTMHDYTNDLINETSPYLLQHAHNPVDWKPWNEATLAQAKESQKLLLISIGYSSCHWCHVMEKESFEDTLVARVMNEHFINIKVDREERPDVDNVYMNAVQLITGSGGWPLNAVALPDGRPVWGGTYFPKDDWVEALSQIANIYQEDPNKLVEYADKLTQGIQQMNVVTPNPDKPQFAKDTIQAALTQWSRSWDTRLGGPNRAPKFMMPNNYEFLLRYGMQHNDSTVLAYVNTTLTLMAYGGIHDQVGGGFSRYSVDTKWHIPHFEKMLYDNAQLVSLYSNAYTATANLFYKETVDQTLAFIAREMTSPEGAFYSALDADSLNEAGELEEGAYYVWNRTDLQRIIGPDFPLFAAYYNVNDYGLWEHGNYVLIRQDSDADFCKEHKIDNLLLQTKKARWRGELLRFRESEKTYPRMDDKILTGWNAWMLKGYLDAYKATNKASYLDIAVKNILFIDEKLTKEDGSLYRTYKDGKATINAYLEDYAAVIQAYMAFYETTGKKRWLQKAKELTDYTIAHFRNPENGLFYFTSDLDTNLVSRSIEYTDNVIPASNSIMAKNIFKLSHYYFDRTYTDIAATMLHNVQGEIARYPSGYSNWLDLLLNYTDKYYEIVIVGSEADQVLLELKTLYIPNALIAASNTPSEEEIFKGRYLDQETLIYVCVNNACKLPVRTVEEALTLLK